MNHKSIRGFRWMLIGAVFVAAVLSLAHQPKHVTQAQTGGTLGYGSKVFGSISAAAPLVTYSFSGNAGDFVAVTADTWTGALDIAIDLVAPNGLILDRGTQNTPGGDASGAYLSVVLPETGIYLLRLSGENGTTGDFLLALVGRSPATATPLAFGQAVDVTIAQAAAPQFFSFEAEDCPTTLLVSDPSEGQPFAFPFVVKVRDQRGQTVALLRGGEQVEDWVTVQPNSGRYEVEVLAADPALSGSLRLLVTCAGDNPNCPAGQAGIAGIPGAECRPCPVQGGFVPNGGSCPDLHLTVQKYETVPDALVITWDPMPGADGYAVYVRGITTDGGFVYLTHLDWVPGDPTLFTWVMPGEGYIGFQFELQVLAGGSVICTQQVQITIDQPSAECPDLGLTGTITDEATNAVTLSWDPTLGADQFALDIYAIRDGSEEYGGRLPIAGGTSTYAFDHFPPEFDGVRLVLWMTRGGMLCADEITIMFEDKPPEQRVCAPWSLSIASSTSTQVDLVWDAYHDADGYVYNLMDAGRNPIPGHSVIMSETQLSLTLTSPPLAPGSYIANIGPWDAVDGGYCQQEVTFTFGSPNDVPCAVVAEQGVPVYVGPGRSRGIFSSMTPGVEYRVIGQAADEEGNLWWELDKTQFPGHEDVTSLWVPQSDVTTRGVCTDIPQGEIPPIIPEGDGGEPGTWQGCGSCDTCGHPGECVTSPEGLCLWDPATCHNAPPPEDDDGDGGQSQCYSLSTSVDPAGAGNATILTPQNCNGGYTPGTTVQVGVSVADPKNTHFDHWSGCGSGGSTDNPVSITMSGSCTIVAYILHW